MPPAGLCKAGSEAERAPRFGFFLQGAAVDKLKSPSQTQTTHYNKFAAKRCPHVGKVPMARAFVGKGRNRWWTIAPRGPMQSGGRDRTSPPLWNFFGRHCGGQIKFAFTNTHNAMKQTGSEEPPARRQRADGARVFRVSSKPLVDHCPPRAYAKRGARPNEPPALEFFWRAPRWTN